MTLNIYNNNCPSFIKQFDIIEIQKYIIRLKSETSFTNSPELQKSLQANLNFVKETNPELFI